VSINLTPVHIGNVSVEINSAYWDGSLEFMNASLTYEGAVQ
jgi:hypothetical protein